MGSILFTACGKSLPEVASESSSAECIAYESSDMSKSTIVEEVPEPIIEDYPFSFVDVFGNEYTTQINPAIPQKPYLDELFIHNGDKLSYEDGVYTSRLMRFSYIWFLAVVEYSAMFT